MKKKKKKVTKNRERGKYSIKKKKASLLKESTATYSVLSLQVSPRKVLAHISKAPYFHKDNFVLYLGDSLQIIGELPDNCIDMIFADPPYNLSNGGFTVHAGRRVSVNKGDWDKSRGFKDDYDFHYRWLQACRGF